MVYPKIEEHLLKKKMTVEELAKEVGTSRSTMYYKLNGNSEIGVDMAVRIRAVLGAEESIELLFSPRTPRRPGRNEKRRM